MRESKNTEQSNVAVKNVRENSVGWMLNALTSALNLTMKQRLEPLGLTTHQFAIMMTLLETDGITQTAIGKKVILPGYAITRNLDVLEEQGFIERQPDQSSRRSFSITLTEQGRAMAPMLFEAISEINADLLSGLTTKESEQLKLLLTKLVNDKNRRPSG